MVYSFNKFRKGIVVGIEKNKFSEVDWMIFSVYNISNSFDETIERLNLQIR